MIILSGKERMELNQLKNEIEDLRAFAESKGFEPDEVKAFVLNSIENSVKGRCAAVSMSEKETSEKVEETLLLAKKILKECEDKEI